MSMKLFRLIIAARIDKVLSVTSAIEKFVTLFRKKKKKEKRIVLDSISTRIHIEYARTTFNKIIL